MDKNRRLRRLPKPSNEIHLADDGYAVHKSDLSRHRSLKRA